MLFNFAFLLVSNTICLLAVSTTFVRHGRLSQTNRCSTLCPCPFVVADYLVNKTNLDGGRCPGRPPFYPAYVNALGTRQMFTLTAVGPKLSTTLPLPLTYFHALIYIVFPRFFFFFLKKLSSQRSGGSLQK
jgi:hypothetical protein